MVTFNWSALEIFAPRRFIAAVLLGVLSQQRFVRIQPVSLMYSTAIDRRFNKSEKKSYFEQFVIT